MRRSLQELQAEVARSRVPYGTIPRPEDVPGAATPAQQFLARQPAMPLGRQDDCFFPPRQNVSLMDLAQYLQSPNLIVDVPAIPAVAPGFDSPGERVEFRTEPVLIIGMMGSVVDFTPGSFASGELELRSIGMRMQINSDDNVTTNGQTAAFATLSNLFKTDHEFFPLMIEVPATTIVHVQFRNLQPAVGGHTLTPSLTFFCRSMSGRS